MLQAAEVEFRAISDPEAVDLSTREQIGAESVFGLCSPSCKLAETSADRAKPR
ncbi:hypothetical protein PF005_g20150 [Phytophthora fragariae]|uniref:Uncharacterized protein n=2 Tax=Phytophthora TaxID=4783 RepID=A0A6A3JA44_9STRA|nr:hypothetical protein PF003_g4769 [Phytophthora fragariae]KAE9043261.1 hypothetical protein PR002_g3436 [Phytophthora rubi]KAE8931827.1 hypothetical protein PF009_g18122 [Phytophthora fragariae]KAE8989054.1 hypothetical protein PF011_g18925 [Phytophthora fragariae]KAE9049354.1 hypothetical protein PR001_g3370 [Phytophthora rubi]